MQRYWKIEHRSWLTRKLSASVKAKNVFTINPFVLPVPLNKAIEQGLEGQG